MTVVCYDGETMAADRKSRHLDENGKKQIKSLDKVKIMTDFKDVIFDGEPVVAVGRAGRVKVTKKMVAVLKRKGDLGSRISRLGTALEKIPPEEMAASSLMILTPRHLHVVRVSRDYKPYWKKYGRHEKVAIGSGCTLAHYLMEYLGLSAVDAVAATELGHDGCGGGVVYTTRILARLEESLRIVAHQDREELQTRLLKATISAASSKLKLSER